MAIYFFLGNKKPAGAGSLEKLGSVPASYTAVLIHVNELHINVATVIDPLIITTGATIDLAWRPPCLPGLFGRHADKYFVSHDRRPDVLLRTATTGGTTADNSYLPGCLGWRCCLLWNNRRRGGAERHTGTTSLDSYRLSCQTTRASGLGKRYMATFVHAFVQRRCAGISRGKQRGN